MSIKRSSKTHKKPVLRRFLFLRKHIDLAKMSFGSIPELCSDHKSVAGKAIIEYARKELGYSPKTASCDIFWSLKCVFDDYRKHYIDGVPVVQMKL